MGRTITEGNGGGKMQLTREDYEFALRHKNDYNEEIREACKDFIEEYEAQQRTCACADSDDLAVYCTHSQKENGAAETAPRN